MKKFCLVFFSIFFFLPCIYSQSDNYVENRDIDKLRQEMRDFKLKYLAKEIDLKDDQKQEFIELYDELETKRAEIYKPVRTLERKIRKDGENASDEDYKKLTSEINKANQINSKLETEYNEKFSKLLSQKQIYKLRDAENNFRVKLEIMHQNHKKENLRSTPKKSTSKKSISQKTKRKLKKTARKTREKNNEVMNQNIISLL